MSLEEIIRFIKRRAILGWQIVRLESSWYKHYPFEFAMSVFSRFASIGFLTMFWYIIGTYSDGNLDTQSLVAYYIAIAGLSTLVGASHSMTSPVMNKIKTGSINTHMVRPEGEFFALYMKYVGYMFQLYFLALLILIVGVAISPNAVNIPLLFIVSIASLSINLSISMMVSTLAFYIVEAQGIHHSIRHILGLFGGITVPLSLAPLWVANTLSILPFASVAYIPASIATGGEIATWQVIITIIWAIVLPVIALKVWKRGIQHYEGVGI